MLIYFKNGYIKNLITEKFGPFTHFLLVLSCFFSCFLCTICSLTHPLSEVLDRHIASVLNSFFAVFTALLVLLSLPSRCVDRLFHLLKADT
jgi:hypothetical protein